MKLVLGSAQFGSDYGLVNGKKIKNLDIFKIENLVFKSKISFIDTSINYGNSEYIIGNSKLKKLKIITKFKLPNESISIKNWVDLKINLSLKNLNVNNIYGLLIHDVNDLFKKNGKEYLKCLHNLKKSGIVKYIGLSVYCPNDLNRVWKFWKPDIVQLPFNIFDQRFLLSKWLEKLKKNKVKIFARSCFLQGLLISDYKLIQQFKKYNNLLDRFSHWCLNNKISRIKACIHFIKKHHDLVDYLVVGFNNYDQLKESIKVFNQRTVKTTHVFNSNKLSLIDPRRWT
jgi:aryl-alcohol dehydrogenase-like predicted oxidoreductase